MKKSFFNGKRVSVFYRPDNAKAGRWSDKISKWVARRGAEIVADPGRADVIIALGGDGTILEAARLHGRENVIICGLNLGTVGFLASVRDEKRFMKALSSFSDGAFSIMRRMMLKTEVIRGGKSVFSGSALNEVLVQNLLGVVELEVFIDGHPMQFIRGTGMLVSTATGSTAYNLSAHGPIVSPDIQCMVLTELLDHNIPTPSIVIKPTHVVELQVRSFREQKLLTIPGEKGPVDLFVRADSGKMFALRQGDIVRVSGSPELIAFAEMEKNYFFKSLQEKFLFT